MGKARRDRAPAPPGAAKAQAARHAGVATKTGVPFAADAAAPVPAAPPPPPRLSARHSPPPSPREGGLDLHWDRRIKGGAIAPDFTLDLHGCSLAQAHARLDDGLDQARAMDARVVLLIAGKPRPAEAADRGERRGAIRAKLLDWLAAGRHAAAIAAIRPAHRRHGGEGALYLVLKRRR